MNNKSEVSEQLLLVNMLCLDKCRDNFYLFFFYKYDKYVGNGFLLHKYLSSKHFSVIHNCIRDMFSHCTNLFCVCRKSFSITLICL